MIGYIKDHATLILLIDSKNWLKKSNLQQQQSLQPIETHHHHLSNGPKRQTSFQPHYKQEDTLR